MARQLYCGMPLGQMVAISAASHRFIKTGDFGRETFRSEDTLLLYVHPDCWNHQYFLYALIIDVEALHELPNTGSQTDLQAALLGAVLTAGFQDPQRFMWQIAMRMELTVQLEALVMRNSMLLFRDAKHPYVRFLELPEAVLFQAGKFPCLVEFMRGFASEINPRATELMTLAGQDVRVRKL